MQEEFVHPAEVEILLFYPCPRCGRKVPAIAPKEVSQIKCDECGQVFLIAPVDEKGICYLKTALVHGLALVREGYN
ncbi:hypothetical protein SAMN04488516_103203 [Desulfonauticus submarinus]|uniref:Uncharacterized protein n=1 Tax=Desulfonauticus submarinus TaxID=206665 RepID=A0A1H0CV89_9BACT|nr:hypothetical protein [Desulfonauticus submarinus]SDN61812.1 hypothetical protein SAMN04488516_103203 [Desulfonauticus submarinus]